MHRPETERPESTSGREIKKGVFLAFEGIDGAGKTTQALSLKTWLEEEAGLAAVYVKEPTDGPWGRKIRDIARQGRADVTLEEELQYFIRDREEDVRENIQPALDLKKVVVADRYFYSNLAYQSALGLDIGLIRELNRPFPVPDLVFFLDISPELSQVRITRHRNEQANLGYEQVDYLRLVAKVFDSLTDSNLIRLDGTRDQETVAREVRLRVETLLADLWVKGQDQRGWNGCAGGSP